jgi:small subunit ribosomal protein S16
MRRPLLVRPAWLICAVPSAVPPVGAGPPFRIYRWEKTTAVAVKIKLKRLGKIREPYYRIVVADARTKRDGRAIEEIGKYHPKAEPSFIEVNSERVQHWLSVGAQPTDPVRVLLKITGDWQKFTGEPGAEGTLRTADPRADKKERFAAAAKESQASKEAKEAKEDKASSQGKAGTQSRAAKPAKESSAKESSAKERPAKETTAKAPAAEVTAEAPDAAVADAGSPDAAVADAGSPDAAVADAGSPDAASDAATEDAADVKAAADEPGSGA